MRAYHRGEALGLCHALQQHQNGLLFGLIQFHLLADEVLNPLE